MKLYFEKGAEEEGCGGIDYYKDQINPGGYDEIRLLGAKRCRYSDYMWCAVEGECIECGNDVCGKFECKDYNPCNGKSGRCRYLKNCYEPDGTEYLLTKDGLKEV